jgi:capsular polysaccharide biosynthesis protein
MGIVRAAFLLVAPVLIAAIAAFAGASHMQPIHAAQSEVVFDLGERGEIGEQYLATQAVVAKSRAVLEPVSRSLGVPLDSLDKNLDVEFPKGSAVIRFQYSDPDGTRAFNILRSIIDQYINLIDRTDVLNRARSLLVPPFVLEKPVSPKPLQAAALGAAAGLAIAVAALALFQQRREQM